MEPTALESRHLVVSGDRAELELGDGRLVLRARSGESGEMTERAFPVEQVRGATLRAPSRGEPGWLHVSAVGGTSVPSGGLSVAMDPYTVSLTNRGGVTAARRLVKMVERHLQERGKPQDTVASDLARSTGVVVRSNGTGPEAASVPPVEDGAEAPAPPDELIDRLNELVALRDSGALTEAEFTRAKQRVIG